MVRTSRKPGEEVCLDFPSTIVCYSAILGELTNTADGGRITRWWLEDL